MPRPRRLTEWKGLWVSSIETDLETFLLPCYCFLAFGALGYIVNNTSNISFQDCKNNVFKLLEYGAILLCQLTRTGIVRFLTFHSFIICICGSLVLMLRIIFNILGLTLVEIYAFQMLLSHRPSSSTTWPPATSESTIRTTIQQEINGSFEARFT